MDLGGRPSSYTPERAQAIVEDIRKRIPYQLAAEANGICEDTLYEWLARGLRDIKEGKNSEYAQFSELIKKAEREKITEHLDNIAARPERWQADAWILERRWYKLFGVNAQLNEMQRRLDKLEDAERIADVAK